MRQNFKGKQFFVFLIDFLLLYLSLFIVLALRSGELPTLTSFLNHSYYFSFAFLGWAIIFYIARLYVLDSSFDSIRFATKLAIAVGLSSLLTALFFYLFASSIPITPKTILFLYTLISYLALLLWRWFFMFVMKLGPARSTVGFVGGGIEIYELIKKINNHPLLGFSSSFIFDDKQKIDNSLAILQLEDADELESYLKKNKIDVIVLTDFVTLSPRNKNILFSQIENGTQFIRLPTFYEFLLRKIPLRIISEAWFMESINLKSKSLYRNIKRGLDFLFGIICLIITAPLWPLIALTIKIESKGPVFFKQIRLGVHNKPFVIYKFRTMKVQGNDYAPTGINDSRITLLGSFLRKSRIDEIPQLLNIIKGDMSFIGPRPERSELAQELELTVPFYRQRHLIKPGLTGWDQVSGEYHSPSTEDTFKKLQYDLYYLKNMSFFLDVSIFFKTIMTVLSRGGR